MISPRTNMKDCRIPTLPAALCWIAIFSTLAPLAAQEPPVALSQRLQPILRARMPASGKPPDLTVNGEALPAAPGLPCFYDRRAYAPAWVGDAGLKRDADELLAALAEAPADGLDPERYRLADLRRAVAQVRARPNPGDLAEAELPQVGQPVALGVEAELRLTDAFLRFAADLRNGVVNPELIYPDCEIEIPEVDLSAALESALAAGHVRQALAEQAPPHPEYKALKAALVRLRAVAAQGGWPGVPDGPSLKPGDRGERVAALRARLEATGEIQPAQTDRDLFDAALEAGLRTFQNRHGLEPDGKMGKGTLAALNVPADARVRTLEVNLDRWRWLPRDLGERHIRVNIAGFSLDVMEAGAPVLSMKVVAGKPTHRTPMFTGLMTQVVLNPYWNVPPGILTSEVIPHLARDPGYADRQDMEVTRNAAGKVVAVRQRPGPKNALGKVKFLFPNRFNVYLHDSPARSLFSRTVRSFSHGCIRVEKPRDLAVYLLKDDPAWTEAKIDSVLAGSKEVWAKIPAPLPVHIAYWTAWVDADGVVQFRDDLYGRDKPLLDVLEEDRTPGSTATSEPSARNAELGSPAKGAAKGKP
jgi:murein L,D-transpeptidase YcbB/YkuD